MQNQAINNKKIAKNTILLSFRMIFVLCLNLYITRETLDALGVDDFGLYNVVCGFVSMFAFLNTSMSNGIQRFFNFELGKNGIIGARRVYVTSIYIQVILLLIILLLAETIGLWYIYNMMVVPIERFDAAIWIFQISLFSFVLLILQVPYNAALMAHERMNYYAFISVLDAFLKLGIVLLIPFVNCDKLIIYGILIAMVSCLNFILAYVYSKRNFRELDFSLSLFDKCLFKSMLSFSGWNVFGTFSNMMREQGLNMILNLFFGPIVNAARGISFQIASGLQSFVANVNIAIRPQMVQSYAQGNTMRTINLMYSLSKVSICTLFILSYPLLLEIDFVLKLWLGNNVPDYTSSFVLIVVLITYLNNLNSAVSAVVHASGIMKNYQLVGSMITFSSLPVAYYILTLGYNPNSVFWVSFIFTIILQISSLLILKSIVDISLVKYVEKVLIPFILVLLSSFIFPLFPFYSLDAGYLRFILVILFAIVCSSISFYLIGLNKNERTLLNSFLIKIIRFKRK